MRGVSGLALVAVLVVGASAFEFVMEHKLLFLSIGLLLVGLMLFATYWRRRAIRRLREQRIVASMNRSRPSTSAQRTERNVEPSRLQFHRDDIRTVTFDGKAIGRIVPNHSKLEAWAFVPVHGNGVLEREVRGRAQKDVRSALRDALGSVSPTAAPRERKHSKRKRRKSLVGVDASWTPLHRAAYKGQLKKVQELIDVQSDLNARNRSGDTPLDVADGHDVAAALRAAGAYRTRQWEPDQNR